MTENFLRVTFPFMNNDEFKGDVLSGTHFDCKKPLILIVSYNNGRDSLIYWHNVILDGALGSYSQEALEAVKEKIIKDFYRPYLFMSDSTGCIKSSSRFEADEIFNLWKDFNEKYADSKSVFFWRLLWKNLEHFEELIKTNRLQFNERE